MLSARFQDSLFEVVAEFSGSVDVSAFRDVFPCADVLKAPRMEPGDQCSWVNPTTLRMTPKALLPGDRLR
eukprot:scaffold6685_cov124-Pinguiococcus_pyrenoidosus.AAC.1